MTEGSGRFLAGLLIGLWLAGLFAVLTGFNLAFFVLLVVLVLLASAVVGRWGFRPLSVFLVWALACVAFAASFSGGERLSFSESFDVALGGLVWGTAAVVPWLIATVLLWQAARQYADRKHADSTE